MLPFVFLFFLVWRKARCYVLVVEDKCFKVMLFLDVSKNRDSKVCACFALVAYGHWSSCCNFIVNFSYD